MIKSNYAKYIQKITLALCLSCITLNYAREETEVPHVWEGNFALPASQQPGPILALGQNILDKHDLLLFIEYDHLQGKHVQNRTVIPALLYGITNYSSLYIRAPIAIDLTNNCNQSSGIGDISFQYEYAYFNKSELCRSVQATVLGNIAFPTGSTKKDPFTGFGSPSFFLGTTINYLSIDWYGYLSAGATLTTTHHCTKIGNQFLYQTGFGRNIAARPHRWILTGIIEFDATYSQRNKIKGVIDNNSGGNVLFNNYTLWFSTQKITVITSFTLPIQHLFGCQKKLKYGFELILGWKLN